MDIIKCCEFSILMNVCFITYKALHFLNRFGLFACDGAFRLENECVTFTTSKDLSDLLVT